MSTTVIIPARWGSKRFPGKPLAPISGYDAGTTEDPSEPRVKTLIHRTWEVGIASGLRTYVATDHHGVAEHMEARGANVLITPDWLKNGTERCAYAASALLGLRERDVVINLQGDACLTPPEWLGALAARFDNATTEGAEMRVATIVADFEGSPNRDDVVAFSDIFGVAHRFERYKGGYEPDQYRLRHFGVYAYRVGELNEYLGASNAPGARLLEEVDSLEQQRWFHLGTPVKLVWSPDGATLPPCEVNVPADIPRVEEELARWHTQ